MKNIEKYPNTKDALDAYNKLNSRELFETWLELEFEETREQSLLEAAEAVTDCNRLGNVAKMREALKRADAALSLISKSAWFIDANFAATKAVIEAGNAIEAALAEPPRNCDRPECANTKSAQKVWSKEDGGKTAYYEWLLETSTKGEAK